jgi:hypothetical protein
MFVDELIFDRIDNYTYITSRPIPYGVGRGQFLPLATILTHTFRLIIMYFSSNIYLEGKALDNSLNIPLCIF